MKCLCGYYHVDIESDWEVERFAENNNLSEEDVKKNNGKEKFKELHGTFDVNTQASWERFSHYEPKKISLFVCPNCGTVRMEE